MPGANSLITLIRSLSGTEKKNFTLFAGQGDSKKAYVKLYQIINSFSGTDEQLIAECKKLFPGTEFNAMANYLYEVLLKSLSLLNREKSVEEKLLSGIQEVKILFNKGLTEDGFERLGKLQELAGQYEKHAYGVILIRMQLHYMNRFQFQNIKEEELLKIQSLLRKYIITELNLTDHSSLYELLNYRFLMKGNVRSPKEKEKLNDLVFSEMNLAGNPKFQSFNLQKNHLLFQSVYFLMTGDHKSSLNTYYELSALFENNRQLWKDAPEYYIQHVKGILNNLIQTGQLSEMLFFIEKLKKMACEKSTSGFLQQAIFVSTLRFLLGSKEYDAALKYVEDENDFLSGADSLNAADRAEVLLFVSIAYMYKSEYRKAARLLKSLIHLEFLPNKQMVRIIRLVNLVTHFELHDFGYLESEIRSLERELKKNKQNFLTEELIIKLLKKYPKALNKTARLKLFETVLQQMRDLAGNSYEFQLFRIFDFENWLEQKITKRQS